MTKVRLTKDINLRPELDRTLLKGTIGEYNYGYMHHYPALTQYEISFGDLTAVLNTDEFEAIQEIPDTLGKKDNANKPRFSLLQGKALEQVMLVGEMGAKKYGEHNYRNGRPITEFIDAAFRHVFIAWLFKGEDKDKESGLSHLAHGAWNVLTALELLLTKPELDNRHE